MLYENSSMKNAAIVLVVFAVAFVSGMFIQRELGVAGPKEVTYGTPWEKVEEYREHAYRMGFYYGAALTLDGHITGKDSTYEYWVEDKTKEYLDPLGE